MAEFGDFSETDFTSTDFEMGDSTADFLAREKAILGDDTDFLPASTIDDNLFMDAASGYSPQDIPLPESMSSNRAGSYDFGLTTPSTSTRAVPDSGSLRSNSQNYTQTQTFSSPPVSTSSNQILADRFPDVQSRNTVISPIADSDFLRNWRSEFQDRLGDRDRREEEKHEQILTQAQEALEKSKKDYLSARETKIGNQERVTFNQDDGTNGKSGWELVSHLVTAKQGKKDISRLHEILQKLTTSGHSPRVTSS